MRIHLCTTSKGLQRSHYFKMNNREKSDLIIQPLPVKIARGSAVTLRPALLSLKTAPCSTQVISGSPSAVLSPLGSRKKTHVMFPGRLKRIQAQSSMATGQGSWNSWECCVSKKSRDLIITRCCPAQVPDDPVMENM